MRLLSVFELKPPQSQQPKSSGKPKLK
jgi:hypothetical protein